MAAKVLIMPQPITTHEMLFAQRNDFGQHTVLLSSAQNGSAPDWGSRPNAVVRLPKTNTNFRNGPQSQAEYV